MKLTKLAIDKAMFSAPGGGSDVRWDDSLPGFGVRIYPSNRKSFVISYRVNGRKRIMVLGAYGKLTLEQARKIAKQRLAEVIGGEDPLESRQRSMEGQTVERFCRVYVEKHAKPHKKTWQEDERRIHKHILPALGTRQVQDVTRTDVHALHHKIGQSAPYEANRTLALLSKMFDLAGRWGIISEEHPNPARKIEKFKEKKRDRWVTPEELPHLARAINKEENVYVRAALWLYLLTGVRKSELLGVKWEDIDFNRRQIRLGETKSGRTHYVPLSEPTLNIINDLPRKGENPYLLAGARKGKPLVNINKNWRRVREEANLEDVRLHDLRRTVGSWLATQGYSLLLIGKVLNHADTATTSVYAHLSKDPIQEAMEEHGRLLMDAASQQADPVDVNRES